MVDFRQLSQFKTTGSFFDLIVLVIKIQHMVKTFPCENTLEGRKPWVNFFGTQFDIVLFCKWIDTFTYVKWASLN